VQFYGLLQSPEKDPRPLGKRLYDIILGPVADELKKEGAQTLLWSLDSNLRYVPMTALSPDGKGYLVEQYQNVVFTRANRERMMRAGSPSWTGTGFGSSRAQKVEWLGTELSFKALPGVTAELQSIFGGGPNAKGILTGRSSQTTSSPSLLSIRCCERGPRSSTFRATSHSVRATSCARFCCWATAQACP
jgi:hypothetical protein